MANWFPDFLALILIGFFIGGFGSPMVQLGILLFSAAVLFQLVTLPVELNASSRAVKFLDATGILSGSEVDGTRRVKVGAAALTYGCGSRIDFTASASDYTVWRKKR